MREELWIQPPPRRRIPAKCPEGPREASMPGQIFGRWTVLDRFEKTKKGEKKWLCRCACGNERMVLERSLKSGGSQSCGCLRREAAQEAVAYDLVGQTFGELQVIRRGETGAGGVQWLCRCSCAEVREYPATLLVTGKRRHCGCQSRRGKKPTDLSGRQFGRLRAVEPSQQRDDRGYVLWKCQCDCGREILVSYNNLVHAHQTSCGCRKQEHAQALGGFQTRVDGTSLDHIKNGAAPKDNTTGVRGVYWTRGKYVAKLVFQKKAYYLGTYTNLEEAAQARRDGEEALFQATVEYHSRWQQRSEKDPQWGIENPIQITVTRERGRLKANFLPALE